MNLSEIIERKKEELEKRFTSDWFMRFGTTGDIDKQGIEGLKSFLEKAIRESVEEAFLEVLSLEKEVEKSMSKKDSLKKPLLLIVVEAIIDRVKEFLQK